MRFVVCHDCQRGVQIGGPPEEVASLISTQNNFPCITPLCTGRMKHCRTIDIPPEYSLEEIPVQGFFRAIHGFGSGVGAPASYRKARELLLTKKVVDLVAEPTGQPERVIVRQLVLEDGTRMHFEASAKGACLYYIEERGPTCREVVERELSSSPNPESAHSNGEEGRRAAVQQPVPGHEGRRHDELGAVGQPQPDLSAVPATGDLSAGVPDRSRETESHDGGHRENVRV